MTGVGLTEADVQRGLIEAAQTGGWLVYHTHDSRRSGKEGVSRLGAGAPAV